MTFTSEHFIALLPILVLAITSIVVMLLTPFTRGNRTVTAAALLGLAATLLALPVAARVAPLFVTPLLLIDGAALMYIGLLVACTLAVAGLGAGYLGGRRDAAGEFHVLLLTAALGGALLAASAHFASLFLGVELLSVSLFGLLAYGRNHKPNLEAGIKYLVLSGVSSAFLLFGIALIYLELGTLEFAETVAVATTVGTSLYLSVGLAFVIGGLAFKLSLVPFHLWTADVYQGAPAPVTAFLATVSKGAVFVVLLRYFLQADAYTHDSLLLALSMLAGASMLLGNVLALLQQNVKRILAYSSIAHIGYLLVAFIAGGEFAVESATYYLVAYFASTLGAFGIVAVLSSSPGAELETLDEYRGLFWRRPWLAGAFSLMLLSLAGIPLTMGFVAKFYVIAASVEASRWGLLVLVIVGSAIGLFYYLRVLVTLFLDPDEATLATQRRSLPGAGQAVVLAAVIVVLWLGVLPAHLIDLIRRTAFSLV